MCTEMPPLHSRWGPSQREGRSRTLPGGCLPFRDHHRRLPDGQTQTQPKWRLQPCEGTQVQHRTQLPLYGATTQSRKTTAKWDGSIGHYGIFGEHCKTLISNHALPFNSQPSVCLIQLKIYLFHLHKQTFLF